MSARQEREEGEELRRSLRKSAHQFHLSRTASPEVQSGQVHCTTHCAPSKWEHLDLVTWSHIYINVGITVILPNAAVPYLGGRLGGLHRYGLSRKAEQQEVEQMMRRLAPPEDSGTPSSAYRTPNSMGASTPTLDTQASHRCRSAEEGF